MERKVYLNNLFPKGEIAQVPFFYDRRHNELLNKIIEEAKVNEDARNADDPKNVYYLITEAKETTMAQDNVTSEMITTIDPSRREIPIDYQSFHKPRLNEIDDEVVLSMQVDGFYQTPEDMGEEIEDPPTRH